MRRQGWAFSVSICSPAVLRSRCHPESAAGQIWLSRFVFVAHNSGFPLGCSVSPEQGRLASGARSLARAGFCFSFVSQVQRKEPSTRCRLQLIFFGRVVDLLLCFILGAKILVSRELY
jgi:hypothetical protein